MIYNFEKFLLEKTFVDLFGEKNKWMQLDKTDLKELKDNMFFLIDGAYAPLNGHPRIKNPDDIWKDKDLSFWKAIDISEDDEADSVVFGRKTKFGVKISGWGHDGEKRSKKEFIKYSSKLLKTRGFYIEVSGAPANIYVGKYGVPTIDNKEDVEKVLGHEIQEWIGKHPNGDAGENWYIRNVSPSRPNPNYMTKTLIGNPIV